MSWLAVLLIGVAVTDLAHSVRPVRIVPECVGAATAVVVGLLAGLTAGRDVAALAVIAGVVVAWGQLVTWGFSRRGTPLAPLVLLGLAVLVAVAVLPLAGEAGGPLGEWTGRTPVDATAAELLLVVAVFLLQLSTGNVVVRLVLAATGTLNPMRHGTAADPETQLKGGRLLGPLERVFILGLGLAGQVTAAAIVVAAKGLLRFPELQSRREQERIHQLTEYFLLGTFLSWLVALGSLALVSLGLR